MSWTLQAAVICGPGRIHTENEDTYYFNGVVPELKEMNRKSALTVRVAGSGSLWAVCDGMGGQSSGEVAANMAAHGLRDLQSYLPGRDFEHVLRSWTRQASDAVTDRTSGGGATLALVYFQDTQALVAHVGDSRVYCLHGSTLSRLTRDHSQVEMLLSAGMITAAEAATHPQRHVITRYLGMDSEVTCDPSFTEPFPIARGDRLMLCSDGVTDLLEDAEIADLLRQGKDAPACADALYSAAMNRGGHDNITAMVLIAE